MPQTLLSAPKRPGASSVMASSPSSALTLQPGGSSSVYGESFMHSIQHRPALAVSTWLVHRRSGDARLAIRKAAITFRRSIQIESPYGKRHSDGPEFQLQRSPVGSGRGEKAAARCWPPPQARGCEARDEYDRAMNELGQTGQRQKEREESKHA